MKILTLILLLFVFIGCSRKNTKSVEIQAFSVQDTMIVIQEKAPEEKPFTVVEQMPSFPGGEAEMMKFLRENLKYPAISEEEGFIGRTAVRFVVSKTGDVKDVVPAMDRYKGFAVTDSLISVVKRMPRWIPGRQRGEAVDVYFTLPMQISPARR